MTITDVTPIQELWREWTFLRPEDFVPIEFEGMLFPSLRHALEATKTPDKQEREALLKLHPIGTAMWGRDKPSDPVWKALWESKVRDWTLSLVAQKFGLIRAEHGHQQRLKYGMWLSLTSGRSITVLNTQCDTFWGKCFCSDHGPFMASATGENILGKIMFTVRTKIIRDMLGSDPSIDKTCDWCSEYRRNKVTPASWYILYLRGGALLRRAMCDKHIPAEKQEAKRNADADWYIYPMSEYPSDVLGGSVVQVARRWEHPTSHFQRSDNWRTDTCSTVAPPAVKDTWGSILLGGGKERSFVFGNVEKNA